MQKGAGGVDINCLGKNRGARQKERLQSASRHDFGRAPRQENIKHRNPPQKPISLFGHKRR
jgi:hypothetical protein